MPASDALSSSRLSLLAFLGPKILGVDLVAECKRYEREMSVGAAESSFLSGRRKRELRAYRVREGGKALGGPQASSMLAGVRHQRF